MDAALQYRRKHAIRDMALFSKLFNQIPAEITEFATSCGVVYQGKKILDVGSGNGVCDLGCACLWQAEVVGVDVVETIKDDLFVAADLAGYGRQARVARVDFAKCSQTTLPFQDEAFDHAISWSVFEHVWSPVQVLKEVYRVLKPGGTLFLQVWPFWRSEWGAHLFTTERWAHITNDREATLSSISNRISAHDESYDSCTRIQIDDLQRALLISGLIPKKIEFITGSFIPPLEVQHISWLDLGVSGIKLIARKSTV